MTGEGAIVDGPADRLLIDIGGSKLIVAAATPAGIVGRVRVDAASWRTPRHVMTEIAAATASLDLAPRRLVQVVAAVPGAVDAERGAVLVAANLPFRDFPLRDALREALDCPDVVIAADRNCGAIGESAWGAARGVRDSAYITMSTGIGLGIVAGGRPLTGARGWAGELGHTPVRLGGRRCGCGQRGCLEAYGSGRAIAERGQRALERGQAEGLRELLGPGRVPTARDVIAAATNGDTTCRRILLVATRYLTLGIATVCGVLDPELVVLGGGLTRSPEFMSVLYQTIEEAEDSRVTAKVVLGELGDDSVLLGALEIGVRSRRSLAGDAS